MFGSVFESMDAFRVKATACVQESIRELENSQDDADTSGIVTYLALCNSSWFVCLCLS